MKDKLTKIKVFLATTNDLHEESVEMADLIENLNYILEKKDVHIYLTKWEYLDAESSSSRKNIQYDKTLEDCEICMVVFGKDFGSYTEKELRSAYERVCKEGVNPSKLYVYFKNIDDLTEDLKRFRDSFPEAYGHFTGKFSDVNTLKNDFLLQFQLFQGQNLHNSCPVEVKDSKVTVFGKDLFIDLMKIPFLGNNETYTDLLKNIKKTKKFLSKSDPEDEDYEDMATELRELEEKRDRMEQNIWSTAIQIAGLNGKRSSERLRKAVELFNTGDNKGADAILKTEDIKSDIEYEIQAKQFHEKAAKIHNENIKLLIDELKMKVKTLENEMSEGWEHEILVIYEEIDHATCEAYGENSSEYIECLYETGSGYLKIGQLKEDFVNFKEDITITGNISHTILYKMGIDKYQQGLTIAKLKYGNKHIIILNFYQGLSFAYEKLKNFNLWFEYFNKAVNLDQELPTNKEWLDREYNKVFLVNSGDEFYNEGKYKEALYGYLKDLSEYRVNIPAYYKLNDDYYSARILEKIGSAYSKLEDNENAIKYLKEALKVYWEELDKYEDGIILGEISFADFIRVYKELIDIYFDMGDYQNAIEYCSVLFQAQIQWIPKEEQINDPFELIRGQLFVWAQEYKFAIEYYSGLLELKKHYFGLIDERTKEVYDEILSIYFDTNRYNEAIEYLDRDFRTLINVNNLEVKTLYLNRLGRVYALMGDKETAKEKFEEALRLLPDDHPETIDTRKRLEELGKNDLKESEQ